MVFTQIIICQHGVQSCSSQIQQEHKQIPQGREAGSMDDKGTVLEKLSSQITQKESPECIDKGDLGP
jgi:hypothetical protein